MRWERVHVNARARETPEGKRSAGRKGGIWGPGNRWGHTLNSVRGGRYLYVFGGYGKDNSQTNDVHVFDTIKQTWSKPMVKGVPPSPRDSHSCTTVGNYLFVFGGTDGKKPLKDLHILDTSSNTWILPTLRGKGPDAREGHSAALVDKRLFIFGGCGKSGDDRNELYYNDLYILDTENLIWERAMTSGTPPSARDSHTCSSWKNKIVVLGGEDASDYYLSDVHILDADTLMWKELNTSGQMLAPRAGHSTVALGRNLFVFGGFTDDRNLYDDLHILNVDTGIWSRVTNINQGPSARFSVAGDCLDEQKGILVFIGGCNATLEALDDMYYLHTDMPVQNGLFEQRQEKLSLRKELKRKCQEKYIPTKGLEKNNDVPKLSYQPLYLQGCSQAGYLQGFIQKGAQIPDSKPAVEKIFEARVTDASHYGYTIETTIDGKLLRGILFSWKSSSGQDNHAYLKKKRMETDEGSIKLNNSYQSVLKTAEVIHQEKNSSGQGKIDVTHGKEPTLKESPTKSLASDSTNSAPLADVYQPKVERGNLVSSTPHGGMKNNIAPDGPYKPNAGNPCGIPSPTPPSSSSQVRDAVEHHHSSSKCPQDSK